MLNKHCAFVEFRSDLRYIHKSFTQGVFLMKSASKICVRFVHVNAFNVDELKRDYAAAGYTAGTCCLWKLCVANVKRCMMFVDAWTSVYSVILLVSNCWMFTQQQHCCWFYEISLLLLVPFISWVQQEVSNWFVQICMSKRLSNASRPLEDGNILIFSQLGELYSKCYCFKCMPH
jgi:hypothetical protein